MQTKRCFKCKRTKPIEEFYQQIGMTDGHLGKCKTCTKRDVRARYNDPEAYKRITAYEQTRWSDSARRKTALGYQRASRAAHPGKYRARMKVNNAVRDGRLNRLPCWCGNPKSEAHHKDYRRPLAVTWLCRKHHDQLEGKRTNTN